MPADPLIAYLLAVETAYAADNATEHTYRPALKALLEAAAPGLTATNEPKRIDCGAPDFVLTVPGGGIIGYVEAKDVGLPLDAIERDSDRAEPQTDNGRQLKRYRAALPNLLFTDCLEFRLYRKGERHLEPARLGRTGPHNTLVREKDTAPARDLLRDFLTHKPEGVNTPRELAERLARLTHLIRDIIVTAFAQDKASDTLRDLYKAFREQLIADLDVGTFADMFAQTLAYGLFAARANHTGPAPFTRANAAADIPKTNPFLRRLFNLITGLELADEPYAGLVDDLSQLLAQTQIDAVLADFGKRTRRQDPLVHFYETFLAAYDPKLREGRGVYYTPEPVVSYLVRSVDHLLKTRFACPAGLADTSKTSYNRLGTGGKPETVVDHRVLVLDPACGTGSFLYAIVDHIRQAQIAAGNAGDWSGYVHDHLLPRLFGFELLMAPYAAAHLKLGLELAGKDLPPGLRENWAYAFQGDERLRVYLTNTLEEAHKASELLFGQWIADEAAAAAAIKRDRPIMVVIGNPPYSGHSANQGEWIRGLVRDYYFVDGHPLGERNPKWLQDDYVKFLRFGQWRIAQSGRGVLAFITNNGYLDNPTFRGMRASLLGSFTDIYILNLHGNSKKRERAPDGGPDENVFDIQQGVAIALFVKDPAQTGPATVHYSDLWGVRETPDGAGGKYPWLFAHDVSDTPWVELAPDSPTYLFVPQNIDVRGEYEEGWKLPQAFPINVLGFQSHRDHFAVAFEANDLLERIEEMRDVNVGDIQFAAKYGLADNRDWQLSKARQLLRMDSSWKSHLIRCLYRPFDWRACYFDEIATDYPRRELLAHAVGHQNLVLNAVRQTKADSWAHVMVSDSPTPAVFLEIKDGSSVFPLYLYAEHPGQPYQRENAIKAVAKAIHASGGRLPASQAAAEVERVTELIKRLFPQPEYPRWPNFAPDFLAAVEQRLGLGLVPDGHGDLQTTFGPEDLFHYAYAIFHAPSYRARYAEFLKIDFPRLPLTSDLPLFRTLAALGADLVARHLLTKQAPDPDLARYPVPGPNKVESGYPKYVAPVAGDAASPHPGRVYINPTQYFDGVSPEVWAFTIGGYQVAEKWLKDRRTRTLTYDDRQHYRQTLAALAATIWLMEQIDGVIPGWPLP
ncbi:MAG: type ISP restriction/modification enzyme [Chloroflexia bacterium]